MQNEKQRMGQTTYLCSCTNKSLLHCCMWSKNINITTWGRKLYKSSDLSDSLLRYVGVEFWSVNKEQPYYSLLIHLKIRSPAQFLLGKISRFMHLCLKGNWSEDVASLFFKDKVLQNKSIHSISSMWLSILESFSRCQKPS